jgi:transposase
MVNSVKGILRGMGYRPAGKGAALVAAYGRLQIDQVLRSALDPVVEMLAELTRQIKLIEESLKEGAKDSSVVHQLQTVPGVGLVTSLTYLSWIDDPSRFPDSRDIGAYLGLRPRIRRSATSEYRGGITGEGNSELRRLLVQSAHTLLRCTQDSELQRWGLTLAERIGKKRAVVAVARKLAVLLHRLWVNGKRFKAFPSATAA